MQPKPGGKGRSAQVQVCPTHVADEAPNWSESPRESKDSLSRAPRAEATSPHQKTGSVMTGPVSSRLICNSLILQLEGIRADMLQAVKAPILLVLVWSSIYVWLCGGCSSSDGFFFVAISSQSSAFCSAKCKHGYLPVLWRRCSLTKGEREHGDTPNEW